MLIELAVSGLGVIESAGTQLPPGAVALTGETGAGKTLVVAALGLLTGGRADRTLVRSGDGEASVEGRFLVGPSHPAVALLTEHGLHDTAEAGDVEILISRTVPSGERPSSARVNGRMSTAGLLSELGGLLVEIAGQHEHQRLSDPVAQRDILDRSAGDATAQLAREVARAVRAAAETRRRLEELKAGERERQRELDVLRFEIAEIEKFAPVAGEGDELGRDASRLENAGALAAGLARAAEGIKGEGGAVETLSAAAAEVRALVSSDPELAAAADRLDVAAIEAGDVAADLFGRIIEPDPEALEEIRTRLDALSKLRRKYGEDETEILAYLERSKLRVAELEGELEDLGASEDELDALDAAARDMASELSSARRSAAVSLAEATEELLHDLAMPGARFEVALEPSDLYEGGLEKVELRVATDPAAEPRPVGKIASGGELSRISLALHLLARGGDAETMVFDEVDAGVGGAAAQAVGRALARLAETTGGQVIVVTHLPQVAAFAEHHLLVSKSLDGGRTVSAVTHLEGEDRIEELSRMLSGMPTSKSAREHARELLGLSEAQR